MTSCNHKVMLTYFLLIKHNYNKNKSNLVLMLSLLLHSRAVG